MVRLVSLQSIEVLNTNRLNRFRSLDSVATSAVRAKQEVYGCSVANSVWACGILGDMLGKIKV